MYQITADKPVIGIAILNEKLVPVIQLMEGEEEKTLWYYNEKGEPHHSAIEDSNLILFDSNGKWVRQHKDDLFKVLGVVLYENTIAEIERVKGDSYYIRHPKTRKRTLIAGSVQVILFQKDSSEIYFQKVYDTDGYEISFKSDCCYKYKITVKNKKSQQKVSGSFAHSDGHSFLHPSEDIVSAWVNLLVSALRAADKIEGEHIL